MDDSGPVSQFTTMLFLQPLEPADITTLLLLALGMILLLILSAVCSASENAFFSHRESDLEELRTNTSQSQRIILNLLSYPKHLLATVLVANSLALVAFVVLSSFFIEILLDTNQYPLLRFFIDAILVTIIILIFGEVMPKVYATQNYRKTAVVLAIPMRILFFIFWPITNLLVKMTTFLEKKIQHKSSELTPEELSQAIDITADKQDAAQEKEILKGIVNIGQTTVSQIMKPRMDVYALEDTLRFDAVMAQVRDLRFSRLPVYHDNMDQIVGVLNMKDLLPYMNEPADFDWLKLLRPPFFVPENKKIDDLLHEFRQNRSHLAVVVDEFGGSNGIVTLEDILEEVFGDLQDEFDDEAQAYSRLDDNTYLFEGKMLIVDFLRITHLQPGYFDDFDIASDTLGGLITELAGKIPVRGEEVSYREIRFIVDAADLRRIKRVKIKIETDSNEVE